MAILWALIVGLVVGALAKLLMPGRDPGGILTTALLGMVGSLVAWAIGRVMGIYDAGDPAPSILASVLGAVLVLALYRVASRRRRWL